MNKLADSSGVQYAVIAGLRTETGPERLVIAYRNEESLRDLIAAPSIMALGFSSRENAVAGSRAYIPNAVAYRRTPEAMAPRKIDSERQGFNWAERRGETGSTLRRLATFLVTYYRDIATTAMVVFSSRNGLSAVIRMALGSSV